MLQETSLWWVSFVTSPVYKGSHGTEKPFLYSPDKTQLAREYICDQGAANF